MSKSVILRAGTIVNEGKQFVADILIKNNRIEKIEPTIQNTEAIEEINIEGKYVLPGCIDDQVHFREPGLIHKATIRSESRAAVAGGITSFMEMPNTVPNTLTQILLEDKYQIAAKISLANYSFFMGSSTGNMLVDNEETLTNLFSKVPPMLIATHCEDEATVRYNLEIYKEKYGEDIPVEAHPLIRSAEACYISSSMAVQLAKKYNTRLHILHISTEKELSLFDNTIPLEDKLITAEACVHHLWFSSEDYKTKGNWIKWNPAVKEASDRDAIFQAVLDNRIDVIATDHAPHTIEEKSQAYSKAPSGGPLVQHALLAMLEKVNEGKISIEKVVEKMAHSPAVLFRIEDRGYIREGYFADLVIVDPKHTETVSRNNVLYQCGWSPFEGVTFHHKIDKTFVNGNLVYADGNVIEGQFGERLLFNR